MDLSKIDPSNLIFESYRIEGIMPEECRSIFLDWALKLPAEFDQQQSIAALISAYADNTPDHPMNAVLREATAPMAQTGRRGGRAARLKG